MYTITIHQGKEKQLVKHHPWVFTGAIQNVKPRFEKADWAIARDAEGHFIAKGWYDEKSHIVLHLLTWQEEEIPNEGWIAKKVKEAVLRRRSFFTQSETTCFRLIHGEADFLPGIAIDAYGKEIRIIISSRFAYDHIDTIAKALDCLLHPDTITATIDSYYGPSEELPDSVLIFKGGERIKVSEKAPNTLFRENGIWYEIESGKSQKSGFYCDQRDNRQIVEGFAKGATVLDGCCYTGAFTLHALRGGAKEVTALDSSESALRHLLYQIHLNENKGVLEAGSREKVTTCNGDVFDTLRDLPSDKYDLIILDPPKLAMTKSKLENAQKAYKDLNRVAMLKVKNGGIIATFSCSGAMSREMFQTTIAWAAADAGVEIQILRTLSAGEDHPIRISFPESEYLKGFIIRVIK